MSPEQSSIKLSEPWRFTPDEFCAGMHFHGSCEPWSTPIPKSGSYDGCFWTAPDPLVAQIYIPSWPGKSQLCVSGYELKEPVRPARHSLAWQLARWLGAEADVLKEDHLGRATSWRSGKQVTHAEVVTALKEFGYTNLVDGAGSDFRAWVKLGPSGSPVRAAAKTPGRLVMVDPLPGLKIYDMANGEADLTDPQYHKVESFCRAFAAGYDAVKIDDMCQSPNMGNAGHEAIGFSQASILDHVHADRVRTIAARHSDWQLSYDEDTITNDVYNWHFAQVVQALAAACSVPTEVLVAHGPRFAAYWRQDTNAPVIVSSTLHPNPNPAFDFDDTPAVATARRDIAAWIGGEFDPISFPISTPLFKLSPDGSATPIDQPDADQHFNKRVQAVSTAVTELGMPIAVPAVIQREVGELYSVRELKNQLLDLVPMYRRTSAARPTA